MPPVSAVFAGVIHRSSKAFRHLRAAVFLLLAGATRLAAVPWTEAWLQHPDGAVFQRDFPV